MKESIVVDEDILNGRPRINGTRISVETIVRLLLSNSRNELKNLYDLSDSEIQAVITYAEENRPRIAEALSRQQHLAKISKQIDQEVICECGKQWDTIQDFSRHCEKTGCNIKQNVTGKQIFCECGAQYMSKTMFFSHVLQQKDMTKHFPEHVSKPSVASD